METRPLTDKEITAIEARCNAATAGPWNRIHYCQDDAESHYCCHCGPVDAYPVAWCYAHGPERRANIDFIAHAREDLPRAVATIRHLEAENAKLRVQLTGGPVWKAHPDCHCHPGGYFRYANGLCPRCGRYSQGNALTDDDMLAEYARLEAELARLRQAPE